jgi:hypothetical protein
MAETAGVIRTKIIDVEVRILNMEAHNITSTPTMYSVEDAKGISDHVNLNPNAVQIQCEMPNSYNGGSGPELARNVMMEFVKTRDKREPITLLTEHASYKNMTLVAVNPVHRSPFKGALVIDLVFHQIGIYGETGLISASGGRPAAVLSSDGTQAQGCGYQDAGEMSMNTNPGIIKQCNARLAG